MLDGSALSDLWFFRAAGQEQSFSGAALRLNITQGAVSQRIRRLEERLGIDLFQRVGRRVVLTKEGKRLFDAADHAFGKLELELNAISREAGSSELVVSCLPSLAMDWLIPRLGSWYGQPGRPNIRIRAEMHKINQSIMLDEGIDLAIRFDMESYDDLCCEDLRGEIYIPVCAPDYERKRENETAESYLNRINIIHDEQPWDGADPSVEWKTWLSGAGCAAVDAKRGDFFNLTHIATRAALLGRGVAMGRSLLVRKYLDSGELLPALDLEVASEARYRLMSLHPITEDLRIAQFVDWLRDEILSEAPLRVDRP
ncbi:LysR family transcriptional regulator [Roseibium sp. SCP14]|uniref:LysR family transcriptional regulator n=1 Tax=Roseibium sp. SCP14 TaxID=3141375 RepID=UPI003335E176